MKDKFGSYSADSIIAELKRHPPKGFDILLEILKPEQVVYLLQEHIGEVIHLPTRARLNQVKIVLAVKKELGGLPAKKEDRSEKQQAEWKERLRNLRFIFPQLTEKKIQHILKTGMHWNFSKDGDLIWKKKALRKMRENKEKKDEKSVK